jgi:hypothetical protein
MNIILVIGNWILFVICDFIFVYFVILKYFVCSLVLLYAILAKNFVILAKF